MQKSRLWTVGSLILVLFACEGGRRERFEPNAPTKKETPDGGTIQMDTDGGTSRLDTGIMPPPGADGGTQGNPDGSTQGNPDAGTQGNPDGGTQGNPDGGTPPPPGSQPVGAPCTSPSDCAEGTCLNGTQAWWQTDFTGGYCTLADCDENNPCPAGSDCFLVDEPSQATTCLKSCMTGPECGRTGYECFEPGACLPDIPTMPPPGGGSVGDPCMTNADCTDPGAECLPENGQNGPTGWPGGYCIIFSCGQNTPCPNGSDCFTVAQDGTTACLRSCSAPGTCGRPDYACLDTAGACIPACTPGSCGTGEVCDTTTGLCVNQPCTPGSCQAPLVCDTGSGACVVDVGTPPPGPVPSCPGAPAWQCTGGESYCGQVVPFDPDMGPGYWDYPLNGETQSNQYRSYVRRDVMMMVKYASYLVDCLGAGWTFGNQQPLGLGDMSESNGAIPGTSVGQPGHPAGTHTNGRDMDIAYYQLNAPNNQLRPVCDHIQGGTDQYHCVAPPDDLDVWRTALFLGLLHESPQLRVIGVDGQIGPLVDSAVTQLCANGYLTGPVCSPSGYAITYETTDMGRGWYLFHHHHFHISFSDQNGNATVPNYSGPNACLRPDCQPARHDHLFDRPIRVLGDPKPLSDERISLP